MARRLRILAVLDASRSPAWQLCLVSELEGSGLCSLEVRAVATPMGLSRRWRHALFRRYESWDRRRFSDAGDPAAPQPHGHSQVEPGDWDADVVIWLADRPPAEEALKRASRGVWYVRQGTARGDREAPLFSELRGGETTVTTALCELTPAGERVLLSSVGPADPASLARSRARACAKAARLPTRYLRALDYDTEPGGKSVTRHGSGRPPGNVATAAFLVRLLARFVRRRIRRLLMEDQWFVAYRRLPQQEQRLAPVADFAPMFPPAGSFYADPFVLDDDQGGVLFLEEYLHGSGRGTLASIRIHSEGKASAPERVLELDTHLSYPFVFRQGAEIFMIPETRQKNRAQLLRATRFPAEWRPERVLIDALGLTDSTLVSYEGRLWLFAALALDDGPALDELHIFSASHLAGEWTPHPRNPVVSDIRSARPAGAFLWHDGSLLRPAQDCSRAYGWRTVLNRVDVLTADDYRESIIGHLEPATRHVSRTHTYNTSAGWETVDGLRTVPRLRRLRRNPRTVAFRTVFYSPAG